MIKEAREYCHQREITRREPIYSANRFAKLIDDMPPEQITTSHFVELRTSCTVAGLSARTIESTISDLIAIVHHCTGNRLDAGQRLKITPPDPQPITLPEIDAVMPQCEPWLKQWIVISYWTCLRLSDALQLQLQISRKEIAFAAGSAIRFTASKTQHRHVIPIPEWITKWLQPLPIPFEHGNDFGRKTTRKRLAAACRRSGITKFCPKNLRQRAITEWMRADATAGRIIHGCGLGVLKHYVDPLTLLEQHQHKVRLPATFATAAERRQNDDVAAQFRQLDPEAQSLVRQTIHRLR